MVDRYADAVGLAPRLDEGVEPVIMAWDEVAPEEQLELSPADDTGRGCMVHRHTRHMLRVEARQPPSERRRRQRLESDVE